MYRKTYGAETVLRKKGERPFPMQVIEEVKSGEDLFATLFANKIKEIKHQAKYEEKKKKTKKKTSKVRSLEVLQERAESLDISNLVDPFDALLITPSNHAEEHKNVSSHSSKFQGFESDNSKIVVTRNNKCKVEDHENKENAIGFHEELDHKSFGSNNRKKEISGFKKESKFFSKDWKKNTNPLPKNKKKYEENWNDSYCKLAEDIQNSKLLVEKFMSGKIDIRGKEKEKSSFKSMKEKTPLETKSPRTLKNFNSSEEVEDEKNEDTSDEIGEESSLEFFCAVKGIRKTASKPINSTPATKKLVAHLPKCALSPILPVLALCSSEVEECTKKLKEENEKQLSLDSKLCHTSTTRFEDVCSDSEQKNKTPIKQSLDYNNICMDQKINNRANVCEATNLSICVVNSPDPFADSESSEIERTLNCFNDPTFTTRKNFKENISYNTLPKFVNHVSLYETSSDQSVQFEKQEAPTRSVALRKSYLSRNKSNKVLRGGFQRKRARSVRKNFSHCYENCHEPDRSEHSDLSIEIMRTEKDSLCLNPKQDSSKIKNQQNASETLLNSTNTSQESSKDSSTFEYKEKLKNVSELNKCSENCEIKSSFQSRVSLNLEESLRIQCQVNLNSKESVRTPSPVNLNSEESLRTQNPVNLNSEESLRTPNPINLNLEESLRTQSSQEHKDSEESFRTPSQVNLYSEKSLRVPSNELGTILEGSSVFGDSIQKLAHSFAHRSSHVVVPLARFDKDKMSSIFRDIYLSSNASFHLTSPLPTSVNCSVLEESLLDARERKEMTFKDVVLDHCGQTEILNFTEVFSDRVLTESKKIGEGLFGEVFSYKSSEGVLSVIKIMPIEGIYKINGEIQKTFEEILPEIVITMELSKLRTNDKFCTSNFPELISCWCVQGAYPSMLLNLWHEFDKEKGSENDSPEILPEDQMYIILELSNVGTAMESFTFHSTLQAFSAFTQVTYTLAAAECALEFEHRDLHWGNILINKTKARSLSWKLNGKDVFIQNPGIQASVIDFTLSRITYDDCCIYNNLANDPEIFEGQGDYQFEIYRLMRNKIENNWQIFEPYNNVLWLSYMLEKLISEVYYHNKTGKAHFKGLSKLRQIRKEILDFKSATEVALSLSKAL